MSNPTPSNILIELAPGDSLEFPGMEVEELFFNGESAEIEHDAGMLETALAGLFNPVKPGKYMLLGFQASYYQDYYGEVDVDYSLDSWREATAEDEKQFHE